MASLFKHQGKYSLAFYNKNKSPRQKQWPLKTGNKKTADKLKARLESDYLLGLFDPWNGGYEKEKVQDIRLEDAITAFMASRANLRPASIKKYKEVLSLFEAYLGGDTDVSSITTSNIEAFLAGGDRKAVTKKTYSTTLSPLFTWMIREYGLKGNPVKGIRLERVPSKFPRYFTRYEVDQLIILMNKEGVHWLSLPFGLNVYLGLRLGELINLKWDHVDLEAPSLTVKNTDEFTTKSGKERTNTIPVLAYDILRSIPDKQGYVFKSQKRAKLSKNYTQRRLRYFIKKMGLDGCSFHTTRHTCASWLAQSSKVGVEALRIYMGHSSIRVTERYMHLSKNAIDRQINDAFGN